LGTAHDLAHTVGLFRGLPDYQRWKQLLHHFYDPFPTVEHYAEVGPSVASQPGRLAGAALTRGRSASVNFGS
jgi:hypothetical protein